jgi:hypothetical protein
MAYTSLKLYLSQSSAAVSTPSSWTAGAAAILEVVPGGTRDFSADASNNITGLTYPVENHPRNTTWGSADITLELDFSTTDADLELRCRVSRINSAGTIQESGSWTSYQTCAADRTFTITQPSWTSPAATDFLAIEVEQQRVAGAHGTATATVDLGSGNTHATIDVVQDSANCYNFTQKDFRFRDDDGSETAATWRQAINTDDTLDTGTNYRLRFNMELADLNIVGTGINAELVWQYNKNSGGWNDITNSSSVIRAAASSNYADQADTTQQLGSGTFVTDNDGMVESNSEFPTTLPDAGVTWAVNDEFETELCFQVVDADVADADTIDIRLVGLLEAGSASGTWDGEVNTKRQSYGVNNSVNNLCSFTTTFTQTPTITVNKPGGAARRICVSYIN